MDKPKLNRHGRRAYHQGKFTPKHPEKYLGNPTDITYRSSWERKFLMLIDNAPEVVQYGSEELIIPYISPIDGKTHRYFTDFVLKVVNRDSSDVFVVEIKPWAQTRTPKVPKTKTIKRTMLYESEMKTYMVNQAKWKAAKAFCDARGWKFRVVTEKELFGKSNSKRRKNG